MDKNQQKLEVLLKIYEDSQLQRRHHESSRMTSSSILIALDTAIIIAWATLNLSCEAQTILPILLIVLGVFGVLISLSHKDRYDFYWRRSHQIKHYLDMDYCDKALAIIDKDADNWVPNDKEEKSHSRKFPCINNLSRHSYVVILFSIYQSCRRPFT